MISKQDRGDIYSPAFIQRINKIKQIYAGGDSGIALVRLNELGDATLKESEKALKKNLIGVIYYTSAKYEDAISNFEQALNHSSLDPVLTNQIYLNLGSSYYKTARYEKCLGTLRLVNLEVLPSVEHEKYFILYYEAASYLDLKDKGMKALLAYLRKYESLQDAMKDSYFNRVKSYVLSLSSLERLNFVNSISEKSRSVTAGYIVLQIALEEYYSGERSRAEDLFDYIRDEYNRYPEVIAEIDDFYSRLEKYSKLNTNTVGIILPLSGKYKAYGERALKGIDFALNSLNEKLPESQKMVFEIRDSAGSAAAGAHHVSELVSEKQVSFIIGGLFPEEGTKVYIESKKRGVLFVSLSQLYLPSEKKGHLLIEMPGSVESIANILFSKEMVELFGSRAAIVYPNSIRGRAFMDAFWNTAQKNEVEVTDLSWFEKGKTDLRDPVKNLLELKFPRERMEELDLLSEIHKLEDKRIVRRIQTLRPVTDFDWVFVPALPKEAIQIIPSFSYFDARKLNLIGGPSWRSRSLTKESNRSQQSLFFVGDPVAEDSKVEFIQNFSKIYNKRPGVIELQSFEAAWIGLNLLTSKEFKNRNELDFHMNDLKLLKGYWGQWNKREQLWVKDMTSYKINKGKIQEILN